MKEKGDDAIRQHITTFDHWDPSSEDDLLINPRDMERYKSIDNTLKQSHAAYDRIKSYHEKQTKILDGL